MKKKILAISAIIILIIIIAIIAVLISKNQKETTINNNVADNILLKDNEISEKKQYNELEVQNTNVEKQQEDNQTNFTFTIKNNGQEKYEGGYARIECLNKDNQEIGNFIVYIPEIEPQSSVEVNASTDMNIEGIYNYQIVSSDA